MSPGTNGTRPQATDDTEAQGHGSHSLPESDPQELAPDRVPRPPEVERKPKRPRGFAAMDRKLVSEIARKGGKAAHSAGTAHEFTSEEARVAGRKGGRATHAKRRREAGEQAPKPQHQKQSE